MTQDESKAPVNPITAPFSVEDVPWEEWHQGERFGSRTRQIGRYGGGSHMGVVMEELAPGKQSCPAHYHLLEEEHLLILEGQATLRMGEQTYEVSAGDYVCFPAGQAVAHTLMNNSTAPCRFLVIGEDNPHDVVVYPDSEKVLVRATQEIYRKAVLEYWEGEDESEDTG
ncbi:MAG: cupin domain-containing protein [Cyanobacteria bacterium CRU_2_1]|nr:cupin domain-containing protein [Cyanobacteria bacterium CRU_2_1]